MSIIVTKGKLKTVKGDVTNPQLTTPNEVPIIPHCCNNLGVMGAGVALAIKKKWAGAFLYYTKGRKSLGDVSSLMEFTSELEPPLRTPKVGVFNMIGQDGIISKDNPFVIIGAAILFPYFVLFGVVNSNISIVTFNKFPNICMD